MLPPEVETPVHSDLQARPVHKASFFGSDGSGPNPGMHCRLHLLVFFVKEIFEDITIYTVVCLPFCHSS